MLCRLTKNVDLRFQVAKKCGPSGSRFEVHILGPHFFCGLLISALEALKNLTYKKSEIQLNIKDSFYRVLKAR